MTWPFALLGDLCEIQIGKTPSRSESAYWRGGTLAWLSIADMNQGRRLKHTKECVTEAGARAAGLKLVRPGTILLSYKLSIGKVGVAQIPMYTNEAIAALVDLRPDVNAGYLFWVLQFVDLLQDADRAAMGATLNKAKLKKLRVPLPPLREQCRIAAVLDKADALRAKRREATARLDQLLQSVFIEMFGEPLSNPMKWPKGSLAEVALIQTGGTPPTSEDGMFDGEIPFITPGDLGGEVDAWRRTVTHKGAERIRVARAGSTLVCCIGATIGKMGFLQRDSTFNQQINAATWGDKIVPLYGYHAMRFLSAEIARRGASTTLPILKKSEFEKLSLIIPPLQKQHRFSKFAECIAEQSGLNQSSASSLDKLFASLQESLFGV
ncbi:hypothetical protein CMZ82_03405 [Lysobacteraceae bacterium NML93-0792]|nr:hypothetical protein CMZ82_03405 [Xanthomonadaceae bacterium NML93-0792]PBS18923.1 hypothetical protein CMZ80_09505 [Xanthomonadaceae bacterium NML93-0831]